MKWDEKARVYPKTMPLFARLGLALKLSRVTTTVKGRKPAPGQRLTVFWQAFTADVIVVEQEAE